MPIKLLEDRVLVKRQEAAEKTTGGIVLPSASKQKPQQGTVVCTGKGRILEDGTLVKMQVKKGDLVMFTAYAGTEVQVDGEEFLVMEEDGIMGILT